jgi:hypothetical protein
VELEDRVKAAVQHIEALIESIDAHEDQGGTWIDSSSAREDLEHVLGMLVGE